MSDATLPANYDDKPDDITERVTAQLAELRSACTARDAQALSCHATAFVNEWKGERSIMETHRAFVDEHIMEVFVATFLAPSCAGDLSWHALKVSCLLARSDVNTTALLGAGGVGAALGVLRAESTSSGHLEVALALLQNVAYQTEGVATILREGGVYAVLHAMQTHAPIAAVQKVGLGVLWNLCDSDEHWVAFLLEGPSLVTVLLAALAHQCAGPRHLGRCASTQLAPRPCMHLDPACISTLRAPGPASVHHGRPAIARACARHTFAARTSPASRSRLSTCCGTFRQRATGRRTSSRRGAVRIANLRSAHCVRAPARGTSQRCARRFVWVCLCSAAHPRCDGHGSSR